MQKNLDGRRGCWKVKQVGLSEGVLAVTRRIRAKLMQGALKWGDGWDGHWWGFCKDKRVKGKRGGRWCASERDAVVTGWEALSRIRGIVKEHQTIVRWRNGVLSDTQEVYLWAERSVILTNDRKVNQENGITVSNWVLVWSEERTDA